MISAAAGSKVAIRLCDTEFNKPHSLSFYSQSLIKELSRISPNRVVLFHPPHQKSQLDGIDGFEKVKSISLSYVEEILNR
jgi:hypothetical protein